MLQITVKTCCLDVLFLSLRLEFFATVRFANLFATLILVSISVSGILPPKSPVLRVSVGTVGIRKLFLVIIR